MLDPTVVPVVEPSQNVQSLEEFVHNQQESAQVSTPAVVGATGHVIDASSDYFTIVMGFLEKFVRIGEEISKVGVTFLRQRCFLGVFT